VVGRDWQWEAVNASADGQSFYAWSARDTGQASPCHLYWIPLAGPHQLINATCSLAAVNLLRKQGVNLSQDAILAGLRDMRWPGRLEVLGREPWVVVDGAHNGDSARKLVTAMGLFPHRRLILIFGALMGHSVPDMLGALLPVADKVILTRTNRIRAVATSDLLREVHSRCREAEVAKGVAEALEQALNLASPADLICATGSLSIAAEMREAWAARQGLPLPPRDP